MAGNGKCRHGQVPGDGPGLTVSGGRERKADEHDRTCSRSRLFAHPGWLGNVVCCAGCGRKVC